LDIVKGPQEATLDSHLLLMASNMGAQKARAMKSGSGAFDVDDFVSKLLQFMGGQKSLEDSLPDDSDGEDLEDNLSPLNWERIGRKAMAKSRRAPALNFMYVSAALDTTSHLTLAQAWALIYRTKEESTNKTLQT